MKILVYRLTFWESPLCLYYHDNHTGYTTEPTTSWLQTNQNSTSDYDAQFSNQCDRCKMLTETSQIITVSGQTHSCPYHNYIYIYYTLLVYYSSTRKKTKFSLPCLACTNLTCTLLLCCALKRLLLLLRTGQTKSHPTLTVWPIADFLPVLYICCCCWSLLYADLNQYNIRNHQLMRTLTTLCTIIMPAHQ